MPAELGLPDGFVISSAAFSDADVQQAIAALQAEYVIRYGGIDESLSDPSDVEPPRGAFFVGRLDGVLVATGAWRRSDVVALGSAATVEIKRMYVDAAVRGRGLARAMLAHLEQHAAANGAEVVVLETGVRQPEAMALYASSGYVEVPGFGHYKDSPLSRCFAKRVGRVAREGEPVSRGVRRAGECDA